MVYSLTVQQQISVLRFRLFLLSVLICASLVIARLADLQLSQFGFYKAAAVDNSDFREIEVADRGIFLDRYDQPLVKNISRYWERQNQTSAEFIEQPVQEEQVSEVLANPSAIIRKELSRWYVWNDVSAHVLGYVGPITKEEIQSNPRATIHQQVGKTGLEKSLEENLAGSHGLIEYEVTATGRRQRVLSHTPMNPGEVIATTIDPYLSTVAQKAMNGLKGAVIIQDVQTGEVLVSSSAPSYNPNVFTGFSQSEADELSKKQTLRGYLNDPNKSMFNRAIAGAYPPGSVFKVVTAIAGLETEKIDKSTTVKDEGVLKVGEYSYANWFYTQYGGIEGEIALERALSRSNDIYFYKVAEFVGPTTLASWARTFGFGSPTGIEIQGEASGLVPDPEWKEKTIGEQWFLGNTYHYGIGQGDLLVTPLQVSQLFQTVANRGVRCPPHVIRQSSNSCYSLGILEENLEPVLNGLLNVCTDGGTAFPFFSHNREFETFADPHEAIANGMVACKTGTAEFGGTDQRGYRKTHAWFSMVVGLPNLSQTTSSEEIKEASEDDQLRKDWLAHVQNNPLPKEVVITVLVESDEQKPYREGSADAAPVALEIFEWMRGE